MTSLKLRIVRCCHHGPWASASFSSRATLLRSKHDWDHGCVPEALRPVQQDIAWAQHLVIVFPLWLGGMPALVYRWYFRAHSLKALERNILGFVGVSPIDETLIGQVEGLGVNQRGKHLLALRRLGQQSR